MKKRSIHVVCEHFEPFHNAAMDTKIVFEIGSIKYRIIDFSSIKYPENLTFEAFEYKLTDNKMVNWMQENSGCF